MNARPHFSQKLEAHLYARRASIRHRMRVAGLAWLCGLWWSNASAQSSANPLNQLPAEDDWSLPAWATRSANAGLYDVPAVPDARSVLVRWRTLNPRENVYDWSLIDAAVATNQPFFLRIWAADTLHVPRWVRAKHPTIPILYNGGGGTGTSYFDLFGISPSNFYALWDPGFDTEFKKFLRAFKARNYLANPNLKFMYAPGAWRYNEWELGSMVNEIKAKAPLTPANFVAWFKRHLDDYVDAANGFPHKLLFTGYGRIENPASYGATNANWFFAANDTIVGNNVLTSYAVSVGMGVREGAQEYFNSSADAYAWGAPSVAINNLSYQQIDDAHPLHTNPLRITATENEAFCDPAALQGGVCSYYHIKMSTLKALQLRVNWLNTRDNLVAQAPDLFSYVRRTANKTAATSPDAWASLRQAHDPLYSAIPPRPRLNSPLWTARVTLPFRNWEKWLQQRDVLPDGRAVPVYQLNSSTQFDFYNFKAFEALRTDRATGSNYLYFNVDAGFIQGGSTPVEIKVTYLDNFAGSWGIEYDAANGPAYQAAAPVANTNDNRWKTATVAIPNAGFSNRQNGGMDFRLFNGGTNDLSVRFVRVVKPVIPAALGTRPRQQDPAVRVYPNPAAASLTIDTKQGLESITVMDVLGRAVLRFNGNQRQLDISGLPAGLYFVRFRESGGRATWTQKFAKE